MAVVVRKTTPGAAARFSSAIGALSLPARACSTNPANNYVDGDDAALCMDQNGRLRVFLSTDVAGLLPNLGVTPYVLSSSAGAAARVVAPGAGAVIASIAAGSLPAGTYDVDVLVGFDVGAPVAADQNNMEFRRGASVVSSLQLFLVINVYSPVHTFRCSVSGAEAVSVNATGAATAGVGYSAQLIATRVG